MTPRKQKLYWKIVLAFLAMLGMFVINLSNGSVFLSPVNLFNLLCSGVSADPYWSIVFFDLRLPKAIAAVLVGLGLAQSGLLMQTYFRNILAGPDVLGVSSGAALGVGVYMLYTGAYKSPVLVLGSVSMAFLGAALVLGLLLLVAARLQSGHALLLGGVLLASFTSSATSLLEFFATPESLQKFSLWSMGHLGSLSYKDLTILAFVVLCVFISLPFSYKSLNALQMGIVYAQSVGVNVRRLRLVLLVATCLLTATITALCGPISFVGVMVPQMARLWLKTSDHRLLMPCAAILGAFILLFCDVLAHAPFKTPVWPVNVLTAFLAAPFLIWVLWKGYKL